MYYKDGDLYWNFGKNKDHMITEDKGYIDWFLRSDFPSESKHFLKEYLENLN